MAKEKEKEKPKPTEQEAPTEQVTGPPSADLQAQTPIAPVEQRLMLPKPRAFPNPPPLDTLPPPQTVP